MWSLFSRDPAKDFGYEIAEKVSGLDDQSIWALHDGKRKSTGEAVSVFVFDIKNSSESQVSIARAAQKRMKTLRHPNMLTYLDGLESEKVLYVVTESVIPLEAYIKNNETKQNELAISWGLHRIATALSFLNNDCNLIHNNVCEASVYVDKAGEWRLGAVDYMYPASGAECMPPVKILPALEKYDPPEKTGGGARFKPTEKWSTDMWGLGCLIWEIFNGNLPKTASLKTLGKIPKSLVPHYCQLVGANPKSRPNPSKFIENATSKNGFMDNKFVDTMLFLDTIQIKESAEKNQFFTSLPPVLSTFPQSFCKYKILPQLIHAFEYGNAGSAVLQPLFKLGRLLDEEEYQKKIVPCIVKLFSSTDRATRVKLLQQMEHFVEQLTPDIVNSKLYPNISQGFMDTNPVVREHTIKSMLHLASKLNYKNLNEDLLKHFARLQSKDDQGGIRTNTTVCLGKVAGHINPQLRQKVLCSAYLRAMKDPFPPARQAGVVAMAATHQFFTLRESTMRLLPALCTITMDPEKAVRDQAFKAIKCFIGKLEKLSENPELLEELERGVNSGGSSASIATSWAGWAVSGVMSNITSKIYKGKAGAQSSSPQKSTADSESSKDTTLSSIRDTSKPDQAGDVRSEPELSSRADEETQESNQWDEDTGWNNDDDWGNMEDGQEQMAPDTAGDGWEELEDETESAGWDRHQDVQSQQIGSGAALTNKELGMWGPSDFAPITDTGASSASSFNWDGGSQPGQDDFFSVMLDGKKKKSVSSRSDSRLGSSSTQTVHRSQGQDCKPDTSKSESGWDDGGGWGQPSWTDVSDNAAKSKTDLLKHQREEKKLQRQQEMEEKRAQRKAAGAMKLGTKTKALD